MKKYVLCTMVFLAFALPAAAESSRRTTADLFEENDAAAMRRQPSAAEIRAENYRKMYQVCDENDRCEDREESRVRPSWPVLPIGQ